MDKNLFLALVLGTPLSFRGPPFALWRCRAGAAACRPCSLRAVPPVVLFTCPVGFCSWLLLFLSLRLLSLFLPLLLPLFLLALCLRLRRFPCVAFRLRLWCVVRVLVALCSRRLLCPAVCSLSSLPTALPSVVCFLASVALLLRLSWLRCALRCLPVFRFGSGVRLVLLATLLRASSVAFLSPLLTLLRWLLLRVFVLASSWSLWGRSSVDAS